MIENYKDSVVDKKNRFEDVKTLGIIVDRFSKLDDPAIQRILTYLLSAYKPKLVEAQEHTSEQISLMTVEQYKRNRDRILRSLNRPI